MLELLLKKLDKATKFSQVYNICAEILDRDIDLHSDLVELVDPILLKAENDIDINQYASKIVKPEEMLVFLMLADTYIKIDWHNIVSCFSKEIQEQALMIFLEKRFMRMLIRFNNGLDEFHIEYAFGLKAKVNYIEPLIDASIRSNSDASIKKLIRGYMLSIIFRQNRYDMVLDIVKKNFQGMTLELLGIIYGVLFSYIPIKKPILKATWKKNYPSFAEEIDKF